MNHIFDKLVLASQSMNRQLPVVEIVDEQVVIKGMRDYDMIDVRMKKHIDNFCLRNSIEKPHYGRRQSY